MIFLYALQLMSYDCPFGNVRHFETFNQNTSKFLKTLYPTFNKKLQKEESESLKYFTTFLIVSIHLRHANVLLITLQTFKSRDSIVGHKYLTVYCALNQADDIYDVIHMII